MPQHHTLTKPWRCVSPPQGRGSGALGTIARRGVGPVLAQRLPSAPELRSHGGPPSSKTRDRSTAICVTSPNSSRGHRQWARFFGGRRPRRKEVEPLSARAPSSDWPAAASSPISSARPPRAAHVTWPSAVTSAISTCSSGSWLATFPRQQSAPLVVDHHAMVTIGLAGVHPCPDLAHRSPAGFFFVVPADDRAGVTLQPPAARNLRSLSPTPAATQRTTHLDAGISALLRTSPPCRSAGSPPIR